MHLRSFLRKQREAGVPFADVAADWNFLLHAATALPADALRALCQAVAGKLGREEAAAAFRSAEQLLRAHAGDKGAD